MENIAVIDIVFAVLILLFMIRAFLRGFIKEALGLAAFALGILAGFFFYKAGAEFIRSKVSFLETVQVLPEILAFIAIFLIVSLLMGLLQKILHNIIESLHLGGLDKLLGLAFGLIEGIALVTLLLFIISIIPFLVSLLGSSVFAQLFEPFLSYIPQVNV
jgi:membrane protein required for colicin V production